MYFLYIKDHLVFWKCLILGIKKPMFWKPPPSLSIPVHVVLTPGRSADI